MSASYHSSDCKILPWGDEDTSSETDRGPRLQIINAHFQVSCHQSLNLQRLNEFVKKGKLFQGRPTMILCRLQKKRVLFFPTGKIQILGGGLTQLLLKKVKCKLLSILERCLLTPIHLSPWKLNNLVVHFNLEKTFLFEKCHATDILAMSRNFSPPLSSQNGTQFM